LATFRALSEEDFDVGDGCRNHVAVPAVFERVFLDAQALEEIRGFQTRGLADPQSAREAPVRASRVMHAARRAWARPNDYRTDPVPHVDLGMTRRVETLRGSECGKTGFDRP
jgi:hypothetical protein